MNSFELKLSELRAKLTVNTPDCEKIRESIKSIEKEVDVMNKISDVEIIMKEIVAD